MSFSTNSAGVAKASAVAAVWPAGRLVAGAVAVAVAVAPVIRSQRHPRRCPPAADQTGIAPSDLVERIRPNRSVSGQPLEGFGEGFMTAIDPIDPVLAQDLKNGHFRKVQPDP
jgi:hypothetical protein